MNNCCAPITKKLQTDVAAKTNKNNEMIKRNSLTLVISHEDLENAINLLQLDYIAL